MASINGVLSPPAQSQPDSVTQLQNHSLSLSAKRKREDGDEALINGAGTHSPYEATAEQNNIVIRDLLDILKSHDTSPSILNHILPERALSTEPQAKRQKSDSVSEEPTILARAACAVYSSLDDVLEDIDSAVADILEKLGSPAVVIRSQRRAEPISAETDLASLKITAFKKRAHDLVRKEKSTQSTRVGVNGTNASAQSANGGAGSSSHIHINTSSGDSKMALTVFASVSAAQPKQLFSSLQIPEKVPGEEQYVVPILQEHRLPNGISATQIVPHRTTGLVADKKLRVQTLGELFPTPATVPILQPPKPSKIATTRGSIVGWYHPNPSKSPLRSSSYHRQSVSTAQNIDYSNAGPAQAPKRKQRDRAMSLGGSKAPHGEAEPVETEAAKLDTLFRSAYSSFAPTIDNSAAVVPAGVINDIWWQQVGEKNFERFVDNASRMDTILTTQPEEEAPVDVGGLDEEQRFLEAVEWYEKHAIDPNLEVSVEKSAEEKDADEILESISELLETLNSYQRIRNVSLKPAGSQVGILAASDNLSVGTPSKPSEQEIITYEILKSQLSLMIGSLPPFAVAKLKPDQLSELGISTKIPVEIENYKGVMEEDEAGTRAKQTVATASQRVSQSSSTQRHGSTPSYGNQYSSRTPAPAAPNYYGGSQTPIRPPVNLQRPSASAPIPYTTQNQRPASNAPYRPNSYGTNSYGSGTPTYPHQNPRPVQQQYNAPSQTPYPTQGYARPVGQSYQNTPQATQQSAVNPRYTNTAYQAPQPVAQQTPTHNMNHQFNNNNNNGHNTNGYNTVGNVVANIGRQPSPHIPVYSPQPVSSVQPTYSTSTPTPPTMPDRRPYLPQNYQNSPIQMNGGPSPSPQPQQQPPVSQAQSTGYSTFMTREEQSNMMERQRAQLAQQQGTQQQARQFAQAGMTLQSPAKPFTPSLYAEGSV